MSDEGPLFPYRGPEALRRPIEQALRRVVDPEVSLSIVDVGLIYGVVIDEAGAHVRLTMTTPACPVADVIIDDVEHELARVLPEGRIVTELVWEPAWTPEMMSPLGRSFMGWGAGGTEA
ncbi:MAG: metal-sulfur cluster assembly factor [Pseudomonadota bacterium]